MYTDEDGDGLNNCQEMEIGTDPTKRDTDGDICPDNKEVGLVPSQGGMRDPLNPYDYFDPTQNGQVRIGDILAVVNEYSLDDPPGQIDYRSLTDRTVLGPDVWDLGPPNGQQRVDDVLASVKQYSHDCGAANAAVLGAVNQPATPNIPPLIRIHRPDVTYDGKITVQDITAVSKYVGQSATAPPADTYDLDGDGKVTTADVAVVQGAYYLNWPINNLSKGKTLKLYFSALDIEGDPITYSFAALPAGATFTNPDGTVEKNRRLLTFTPIQAGNYTFTLKATSSGQTTQKVLNVTVP